MQEFLTKGLITSANMPLFIVGIALCVIIPYLLGSLNFGVIISKLRYRDDVRTHGSGNAGMTNMLRTYGKSAALITLLGDLVKAIASAVFGLILMPGDGFAYIAGIACMLGHAFPIYFKFKGGKGVVVALGTMLVLNPKVCGACLLIWILVVSFSKYVSLSSMIAASLFPLINFFWPFWFQPHPVQTISSVIMAVLIVWLHRENIVRLMKGTENKFSLKKKPENIRNKLK